MALSIHNKFMDEEEENDGGTPLRYVPLQRLYSSTAPCLTPSRSSNVMSKKVKARKLDPPIDADEVVIDPQKLQPLKKQPPPLNVYCRRAKRPRHSAINTPFFKFLELDLNTPAKQEHIEESTKLHTDPADHNKGLDNGVKNKKKTPKYELLNLGIDDSSIVIRPNGNRLRKNLCRSGTDSGQKCNLAESRRQNPDSQKKWVECSLEESDPYALPGLKCKVYWPMDEDWYAGSVAEYNLETCQHRIEYADGEEERLILSKERIKFYISREEMRHLKLKHGSPITVKKNLDFDEMVALAASFDDCQELEAGDIIWAKLTGHAMWPAVIVNESQVSANGSLKQGDKTVPVQFFGTHDFARINLKQATSFGRGLLSEFHLKCKQTHFPQSLEEAKMYLTVQKLPARMLRMQKGNKTDEVELAGGEDEERTDSSEDDTGDEGVQKCIQSCPFEIGNLRVVSLGKIVSDSKYFHSKKHIWPEGYTAVRKYVSMTDPNTVAAYKMEVLRDPRQKALPLFRVTLETGEQFQINGSTPSACWNKIYKKIEQLRNNSNGFQSEAEGGYMLQKRGGSYMFGFSITKVSKLIQKLPYSYAFGRKAASSFLGQPSGYRPVRVDWKDIDKCNVCHMDEEYENNLFLQCDKCRMMVHARCYGEIEPLDGVLWLCNLCRPGAPTSPPPCCLCPIIGGAMKPTTDGRWAHLTCAMWIPETCLKDIKRMEPIDGLERINKDRWKLLCSICGVSYGACIQCSNNTCRVAYHPLCARAAGLCVELEDEDKLHLMSVDEDDDQCVRLLSFCKKHRQPSGERSPIDEKIVTTARNCSHYIPPSNPSGCARSEPYDFIGRRGLKEPAALAAASIKRLFVENRAYLVSGYRQNGSLGNTPSSNELVLTSFSSNLQKLKTPQLETPKSFLSMAEKYQYMRKTFKKRLAFGKSGIHGFGIFAKLAHRTGDMVIEYTGELVRPPVADIREHRIYNSLVGAGTYMFRIDDERVIDATKAGSIAHLINHSCEPNCYSRVITVHGDEHIIIFAKRDIKQWEELTYDYRFVSMNERLACYCGFPRCRRVVNDIEAEEQLARIRVPRSELIEWNVA